MAAPARADPVIVAGGDVACAPEDQNFNNGAGTLTPAPGYCHEKYTSDLFAGVAPPPLSPLHLLALGDLQYEDGRLARFTASYDPSWGRAKDITKPVPGNHEYGSSGQNYDANATGYFTYFKPQLDAMGPYADDPRKGWYSFDVPVASPAGAPPFHWHLVALNSECASGLRASVGWEGGCAAGSSQEQWLRSDLAADTSDCTIAYWHHPRFSSGGIGDNPIMDPIWKALYDDYADLVLSGHDHDYERFVPQGPTGQAEPGRGIRELVVGTGGKNLPEGGQTRKATSVVYQNTVYGVLKLTLHGPAAAHPKGWYEWEFVDDGHSGKDFVDSGSADCVSPPAPGPAASAPAPAAPMTTPAATPAAPAALDLLAPSVSHVSLFPRRFRVGRSPTALSATTVGVGTTVHYTLSEAATARLRVDRGLKGRKVRGAGSTKRRCVLETERNATRANGRCTVYRNVGTLLRKGRDGPRKVRFSGRIGNRTLKPGRYRLRLSAKDAAGNAAKPAALRFTVAR